MLSNVINYNLYLLITFQFSFELLFSLLSCSGYSFMLGVNSYNFKKYSRFLKYLGFFLEEYIIIFKLINV